MGKDTTAGIVTVVLGLIYLAGAFQIPVRAAGDVVGPRAFPSIVATLLIGCGCALIVKDVWSKQRQPFSWGFVSERGVWGRIAATMASGIVYGLVLDWLGYLIATFIFMAVISSLMNVGRHKQNLVISALFSVTTFVTLGIFLHLSLPRGVLGAVLPL